VQTRRTDDEATDMISLLRSLLFVPGDSERKQAKALASPADALILDLEDSVAETQLADARRRVRELLIARRTASAAGQPVAQATGTLAHTVSTRPHLWVRVHSLSSGRLLEDLVAVLPGAPVGLVLPKVSSPAEIVQIDRELAALETQDAREPGSTKLIVIATETPQALLNLPSYAQVLGAEPAAAARVAGLTWGAEDLSTAIGATSRLEPSGGLTFTFQLARSLCLLTAAAIGVPAIDGVHVNFRDPQGLEREASQARRDGFSGKLAIHPDQIASIHSAFKPSESELARARRIVAAFAASPGAGVLNLEGEMIDRPHLLQARRLLASQENASGT
jgi:citrate lyase subunit beta/citryl-CoA lyase